MKWSLVVHFFIIKHMRRRQTNKHESRVHKSWKRCDIRLFNLCSTLSSMFSCTFIFPTPSMFWLMSEHWSIKRNYVYTFSSRRLLSVNSESIHSFWRNTFFTRDQQLRARSWYRFHNNSHSSEYLSTHVYSGGVRHVETQIYILIEIQ